MEAFPWLAENWFDLLQTVGIVGGLIFTAVSLRKDDRAREIANLLAVNQQYRSIWKELYDQPKLFRVLQRDVNLKDHPVTDEERLFVKQLIVHLDTVRRAMKAGLFVKLEGLQADVREFFSLPIPQAVWEKLKPLQDADFVAFVEDYLGSR